MGDAEPSVQMPVDQDKLKAVVDMIGRCGATQLRIGHSDTEDGPVIWYATASFRDGADAGAGMNPLRAAIRLAEQLIDGGACAHCNRMTGLVDDRQASEMPLNEAVCYYAYDPELKTFRRSCEGRTAPRTPPVRPRDPNVS